MSDSALSPVFAELILAIQTGAAEDVAQHLAAAPELLNVEHVSGVTPLYFAVRHQRPTVVWQLVELGANVNPPLPGRVSLLEMATPLPCQQVYDCLHQAGARRKSQRRLQAETKPVYPTIWNLTVNELPLCEATFHPAQFRRQATKLKLRRLRQLLTEACGEQEDEFAIRLIDVLPTVDYCTDDEGSPLLSAASAGSLNLVRALRSAGARKNLIHAFHFAVDHGHYEIAAELLEEVRTQRHYWQRESPAMALKAAKAGYTKVAELLLPYAYKRSVAEIERRVREWRSEYYDMAPRCFHWHNE